MPPGLDPSADLGALAIAATRWVCVASIGMSRPLGLMLIMPVFTRAELGNLLRLAFAFALSLPLLGTAGLVPADLSPPRLAFLGLKELFIGLAIGYLLGAPFWAIQAAGELIDTQRGISNPAMPSDPSSKSQASATNLLLGLLAITIFVAADGMNLVVDILYGSYRLWPVGSTLPGFDAVGEVGRLADHVLRLGLTVGGPVVALMLLLELCVALLGRFAPSLHLSEQGAILKNAAALAFLLLYAHALFHYVGGEVATLRDVGTRLGVVPR